MEQHPVPQQISSYEFRLVGDMTLRQFGMVAAGGIISLLLYASPLPFYIKWPFMFVTFFTGIAFAFFPFEERPLQTWVIAFLKAVYSPTQFLWHKKPQKPAFFEEQPLAKLIKVAQPVPASDSQRLTDYLAGLPQKAQAPLDQNEKVYLDRIQQMFHAPTPSPQAPSFVPQPKVEPVLQRPASVTPTPAAPQVFAQPAPVVQVPKPLQQEYVPPLPGNVFRPRPSNFQPARYMPSMLPSTPTLPNVLIGMVLDSAGKMVEGAIIEIRDSQRNPVRAFRTNRLGQFQIVTPLPNDIYEVEVEKEGLQFDIIKVTLTGQIIRPLEIRAKGD